MLVCCFVFLASSLMRRQPPNVEWHIAEDDAEWENLRAQATAESGSPRHTRRGGWRFLPLLLLGGILAGAGGWAWQHLKHEAPAAARLGETQVVAISPQPIAGNGDLQPVNATPTPTPGQHPLPLQRTEAFASQEVVRMLSHPEQALHLYQEVSSGALRTTLDAALWGPARRLETTSFIIHFRHRDARTVTRAAAKIETLYTTMLRNFDVDAAPEAGKLVIIVSELQSPESSSAHLPGESHFVVRSPSLYGGNVQIDPGTLLTQAVALELIDYVLARSTRNTTTYSSRRHILDGLRLWQLWDVDLPLADWRPAIVQWIFDAGPAAGLEQPVVLPDRYAELCAIHTLWLPHPAAIQIPLVCTELDRSFWRADARFVHLPPLWLPPLWAPVYLDEEADWKGRTRAERHPGQAIALATIVEFAVATYGRERLPEFVAALGQHDNWETFIPAVYGVSVAEFEHGWQTYLSMYYLSR
jgi:hypothetical protein